MARTPKRPMRRCDSCEGLDDHPKHTIGIRDGRVVRHLDCCAAAGCVICTATEKALKGKRGQDLIDAIADGALDGFKEPEITNNKELGING